MCFFNPDLPDPPALPPVKKADPTIKTDLPQSKKLATSDEASKKVKFGDTARAASTAKTVGTSDLKIPLNTNKKGNKTGGVNVA